MLEWSLFVLVGILVLDFCSEVAKEYQKIKSDRENKGGGPSKTSDGGSGKTDKVRTANKTGAIKVYVDAKITRLESQRIMKTKF